MVILSLPQELVDAMESIVLIARLYKRLFGLSWQRILLSMKQRMDSAQHRLDLFAKSRRLPLNPVSANTLRTEQLPTKAQLCFQQNDRKTTDP